MGLSQAQYRLLLEINEKSYLDNEWVRGIERRTMHALQNKDLVEKLLCDDGDYIWALKDAAFKYLD